MELIMRLQLSQRLNRLFITEKKSCRALIFFKALFFIKALDKTIHMDYNKCKDV